MPQMLGPFTLWTLQKFSITIPGILFRTKESVKLFLGALRLCGSEEASRLIIPAFRIWFEQLRRLVILYFSRPMELFFAGAFMSFSPCRGFF